MNADVAQCAIATLPPIVSPTEGSLGIVSSLLQIARPEVVDLPQCPLLDQLSGEPDRGHEAVVEARHVLHARFLSRLPHSFGIRCAERQWLLAQDVLSGLCGGDGGLRVCIGRGAVIEYLDTWVLDHLPPVGVIALVPVADGGLGHCLLRAAAHGHQPRPGHRRPEKEGHTLVGIGMGFAHETVTQHPHADLWHLLPSVLH